VVLLAAGCWIGLGALLLDMVVTGVDPSLYHLAQATLVLAGLSGCAAWLAGWRCWRALLAVASAGCLVLSLVWLFVVYTWKFLETDAWPVALWNTFAIQWLKTMHFMADGWIAAGVLMIFYEWLLPLAQAGVLAWLIITRSKGVPQK
jgi:hypothetical protein